MLATDEFQPGLARRILRQNGWLAGFVVFHSLVAIWIAARVGVTMENDIMPALTVILGTLTPCFLVVVMLFRMARAAIYEKPKSPLAWLLSDIRTKLGDAEALGTGALRLLLIVQFTTTFTALKALMPDLAPFQWDPFLADLDRAMHFGRDPWVYLTPLLNTPWAVTAVNAAYHLWILLVYFLVFLACFSRARPRAATTFLLAYVIAFAIGGNLLATVLSSAGPVYYQPLGLGERFVPLIDALHRAAETSPVWALPLQDALWAGYQGQGGFVGISAMPSMHVATATLMAIYGFTYARWAGWALSLFAAAIMLGSVLLGWHYAIDGYAGAALAIIVWALATRLVEKTGAN